MDFIPASPLAPPLSLILAIPLVIGSVVAAGYGLRKAHELDKLEPEEQPKSDLFRFKISMALLVILALGGVVGFMVPSGVASTQRTQAVIQEIDDAYGIKLTDRELRWLDYPGAAPTEDFKVFGSMENLTIKGDGYEKREIYLIWRDSNILIAESTDGESFTPLDAKN